MQKSNWMLYGAYGFTGKLILREALARGHRPILAGRQASKLKTLAEKYNLEYRAFDLNEVPNIEKHLDGLALLLHSAGPFIHTSTNMVRACMNKGVHYTDITGEITVFKNTFAHNLYAREKNIVLMSGIGFDVVPTDCLAKYVSKKIPNPIDLTLAFSAIGKPSIGTLKSMLESVKDVGTMVRRNSVLKKIQLGQQSKTFVFPDGEKSFLPISWGDLETAYHSTGISNITTYISLPSPVITLLQHSTGVLNLLLQNTMIIESLKDIVSMFYSGPSNAEIESGKTAILAQVTNGNNEQFSAFLETREGYFFTAQASVLIVEKILKSDGSLKGSLTPSMAFGEDLILEIEGVRRTDLN
jgi:short subunit dehydrogenase-like uncharacterized protein